MCSLSPVPLTAPRLARTQGAFYVLTGVWPLLNIRSFEWVTGPKTDRWLVKTVGVLVAVNGGVLSAAGLRGRTGPEMAALATGSALGLAGIDTVYALKGRISRIYLLDALCELLLAACWVRAWPRHHEKG